MFAKSKKSAFLMACLFGLPVAAIALVASQIRYAPAMAEQNPNVVNGFAGVVPALMALAILALSLGLATLVIYRLDESHYGLQGAVRWVLAGILYGLLQQVVLTPIPSNFDYAFGSILKQIGGDLAWKAATLVLAYILVFPLVLAIQKWRRKA